MASLTIAIPTYNRVYLLEQAIQSVLSQSFTDFEIIVADNASTDSTRELCLSLQQKDKRLRYVRNQVNLGMVANWCVLADLAQTPYVKYLMDDDMLLPECLQAFDNTARNHPNCVLITCLNSYLDGASGNLILDDHIYAFAPERPISGEMMIDFMLRYGHQIGCPSTVMFHSDAVRQVMRRWSDELRGFPQGWAADFATYALVLQYGDFYCINKCLIAVRVHAGMASKESDLQTKQETEAKALTLVSLAGGGSIEAKRLAGLQLARSAILRGISCLLRGSWDEARVFFLQWLKSEEPAKAAQLFLRYDSRRLLRARLQALPNRGSNFVLPSDNTASHSHRYRDRQMRVFWDSIKSELA